MAYDITSSEAGVRYPASMDQQIITEAAQLAALEDGAQICAWYAANRGRQPIGGGEDPWPAALGTLQATTRALLGIIDRQREEIAALREGIRELRGQLEDQADEDDDGLITVPMVCTACRQPVSETSHGDWGHVNMHDGRECGAFPVKAMVAAGNESVPRA